MNMQARYLGIGTAVVAVALLALSVSFQGSLNTEARAQAEDPPLLEAMNTINSGYRSLRRQARRENWDESSVETVREMLEASVVALYEAPPMAETIPAGEREQFMIAYQKESTILVKELLDLHVALIEGRNEDIQEHLVKLADIQKEAHDKFLEE